MSAASSSSARPGCVVNEADVPKETVFDRFGAEGLKQGAEGVAAVYRATRQQLGQAAGKKALGCSLMAVATGGCTAFPYHAHAANEEAIYVLSGEGIMRRPQGDFAVRAGDYIALLTGEDNAHQLWNYHSSEPLRYLCLSTEIVPEVLVSDATLGCLLAAVAQPAQRQCADWCVCWLPQAYLDSGKIRAYTDNMEGGIYLRNESLHYLRGEGNRYTPHAQKTETKSTAG